MAWSSCLALRVVGQPIAADVAVRELLDALDDVESRWILEQVLEALLRPQVLLDRQLLLDLRDVLHRAVLGVEHGKETRLFREARDADRVGRRVAPAERAGHQ